MDLDYERRLSGQKQRSSVIESPHKGRGDRSNPQHASKRVEIDGVSSVYLSCNQR